LSWGLGWWRDTLLTGGGGRLRGARGARGACGHGALATQGLAMMEPGVGGFLLLPAVACRQTSCAPARAWLLAGW
jgi:hypothetical protein